MSEMRAEFIPDGFDVFMTSSTKNTGYSGVCTYVRKSFLPEKAYLSIRESMLDIVFIHRILNSLTSEEVEEVENKYDSLFILACDQEGRVLLVQYSDLSILNVYFPAGVE